MGVLLYIYERMALSTQVQQHMDPMTHMTGKHTRNMSAEAVMMGICDLGFGVVGMIGVHFLGKSI